MQYVLYAKHVSRKVIKLIPRLMPVERILLVAKFPAGARIDLVQGHHLTAQHTPSSIRQTTQGLLLPG